MEVSKTALLKKQIAERNKKVAALYAEGMLRKEIAQTLNISLSVVSVAVRAAGLAGRRVLSKSEHERRYRLVREKHASGMSNARIADAVGLCPTTVGEILQKMGLISNTKIGPLGTAAKGHVSFNDRIESVADLIRQGLSREQIATALGVKIGAVNNWYSAANKIVSSEKTAAQQDAPKEVTRADLFRAPLPVGHPIAVDAMWRGLEKYREPLAI